MSIRLEFRLETTTATGSLVRFDAFEALFLGLFVRVAYMFTVAGVDLKHDPEIEREILEDIDAELIVGNAQTEDEVIEAGAGADALLVSLAPITETVFEALEDVKVVGRYGIGVDNIDLDAATAHGVQVVHVPSYCEDEVSTHALTLLLASARRVCRYNESVKGGGWDWELGRPIHRLRGSTLGLAGFGKIPRLLVEKTAGFDFDVIAYDPYLSTDQLAEHGVEKVDFDDLLERSDFISVHTPLTDETEGMFDAEAFGHMKESAILINTSRGPVVDTDALYDALTEGEIDAAGLDVMPEEPPGESPLFALDTVTLTPHMAFYSEESIVIQRRTVASDVARVLRGEPPENLANPDVAG